MTMPHSHIFVCDNPQHDSAFDSWLREEVGLDWVPTYMIVRDGWVIGTFRGGIDKGEFTRELGTVLENNIQILPVSDSIIYDLDNNPTSMADIMSNGVYIVEISWIDCKDCKYQDENFTDSIYLAYTTDNIYRYYIRSDRNAVLEYYS